MISMDDLKKYAAEGEAGGNSGVAPRGIHTSVPETPTDKVGGKVRETH